MSGNLDQMQLQALEGRILAAEQRFAKAFPEDATFGKLWEFKTRAEPELRNLADRQADLVSINHHITRRLTDLEGKTQRIPRPDAVLDGPISSDGPDTMLEGVTDAARHYRTLYLNSLEDVRKVTRERNDARYELAELTATHRTWQDTLGWVMDNWKVMIERQPLRVFAVPASYAEVLRKMRAKLWGLNYAD